MMEDTNVLRAFRERFIFHSCVWHIGTLRREEKGWDSHEGDGISVSLDPAVWRSIARLSGPLYRLEKEHAVFLDVYRCLSILPLMRSVWKWALREQYVERRHVHRVDWYDFEEKEWRRFPFLSEQQAREEYQSLRLALPAKDVRYNQFFGYVPTEKMRLRAHHQTLPLAFVRDFALSFYAEDHLEIDGLWWEEAYNPSALSAPRGVIFTTQLSSWKCEAYPAFFS